MPGGIDTVLIEQSRQRTFSASAGDRWAVTQRVAPFTDCAFEPESERRCRSGNFYLLPVRLSAMRRLGRLAMMTERR